MSAFDIRFNSETTGTEARDFVSQMMAYKRTNGVHVTVDAGNSILDDLSVARRRYMNSVMPVGGNSDVRHIFRVSRQKSGVKRW